MPMHFIGSHALQVFLLHAVLACSAVVWGHEISSDSIQLDGKILIVDAQVRFDSTAFSKTQSSKIGRTTANSRPFRAGFVMTQVAIGMPEKLKSGSAVGSWVGQPSGLVSVNVGSSHLVFKKPGRSQQHAIEWGVSLERLRLPSLNVAQLSDSVIGFVQSYNDNSLQAVIYERFPIGVETDTVAVTLSNRTAWRTSLQLGWTHTWRRHWAWHAAVGATVILSSETEFGLEVPDINRGRAYAVKQQMAGEVFPLIDVGLRRRFSASELAASSSYWTVALNIRAQPQLNSLFWSGIQLRWHWSS
jgi:hypothetical protein